MVKPFILQLLFVGLFFQTGISQNRTPDIYLNQIGFYPDAPKTAIVAGELNGSFYIVAPDLKEKVFTGVLSGPLTSSFSDRKMMVADFSKFKKEGTWTMLVPSLGYSWPFEIKPEVHREVATAALKAFYFQRMSTDLPERYAGKWRQPLSHPDKQVYVHASAVSRKRKEGAVISSPGGWYNAGDYNKYIVNSGIATGTLLALYEDFPEYFKKLKTNIPESDNGVPDLLDEAIWNLRWMLTMQDPRDGGVYHKCTTADFEAFVRPEEAQAKRYVVQKSTAAALNFAAVMAQASRIFEEYETDFPGMATTFLKAAKNAWQWAQANPNVLYDQEKLNEQYFPAISTGAYEDDDLRGEFIWAAVELYIATGSEKYLQFVNLFPEESISLQNWQDVRTMGYLTLLRHEKNLPPAFEPTMSYLKSSFLAFAKGLVLGTEKNAWLAPMENNAENFVFGSNGVCANQGMVLIYTYRLTGDPMYLNYAVDNLDYLLGRNATGFSFVTGFGGRTPMQPYHRPSATDGVEEPIPGFLVGGPNPDQQDQCRTYPNKLPDESYTDDVCSYSSNSVAINWNAPFVYLAFAVDILYGEDN